MNKPISYISIEDILWLQFNGHFVSFGFPWLPKDIHFTIAFNKNSSDVNFHVTKNTSDKSNKPQIDVLLFDKVELENSIPAIVNLIAHKMLQPVNLRRYYRKYAKRAFFMPLNDFENEKGYLSLEKGVIDTFQTVSKIRGKRLRIQKDAVQAFEKNALTDDLKSVSLDRIRSFRGHVSQCIKSGVILSQERSITVLKINSQWYIIRKNGNLYDFLNMFMKPGLARAIYYKTLRAIIKVKYAKTREDVNGEIVPIRLFVEYEAKSV